MIELNPEQRQAVAQGEPVRIIDPVTHDAYVRGLKHEEFYVGRLEADPEGIPPWGTFEADWSLFEATGETPAEPA